MSTPAAVDPDIKWLTLKGLASYLGMKYDTVQRKYPRWRRFGVKAYSFCGGRVRYFKIDEVDRAMEAGCLD